MNITAVVPTTGRAEMLNSVIFAIDQQENIDEFILLDESDIPVYRQYQVEQAIDLLSRHGIRTKILRDRRRMGIGSARTRLVQEASNEWVLMVDDDVVMHRDCSILLSKEVERVGTWAVPSCILVSKVYPDGYMDVPVSRDDPFVQMWVRKFPISLMWNEYKETFTERVRISGTQVILLNRGVFLDKTKGMEDFGNIPREDTYMTAKMGMGIFVSAAKCFHFVDPKSQERSWNDAMFYRLHDKILEDPDKFREFIT